MRKYSKFIVVAGAVAALVAPSAAMANASSKPSSSGTNAGVTENGWVGTKQGSGTMTQQYSASYTDPVFGGPLTCTGVHQIKKNGPAQDSFTCMLSGGGWYSQPTVGQQVTWNSDWEGVVSPGSTLQGTMTVTSLSYGTNGNVIGYTGVATYPAS
jgi:hypothetical protein